MAYARGKAAWREMKAMHAGMCSYCKEPIEAGERIVVKQIGRKLTARHERCRDLVSAPVVTQVEQGVYRIKKQPKDEQEQR